MARVLFLQDSGINESLALTELSALLKSAGHPVSLVLGDEERDPRRAIRRVDPDLIVIPCPVAGHERALDDAAMARDAAPGALIAFGGTHATFAPEMALLPQVDAVCIGEAEGAMQELADRIDRGESWKDVRNLAVEVNGELVENPLRPLIEPLDDLPLPDRELYHSVPFIGRLPWKKFATGRGCVHSCSYCWNTSLAGQYEGLGHFVRRKSPRRAVDEVLDVASRHPLRRVHFSDDLFTVHPPWLEEFSDLYRDEVGIPFTCNTSIPLVNERTMEALTRAGCAGVAVGVETGNEALREKILGKPVTNDHVRYAAALIKGAGLQLFTFNMVGSPGETVDDVLQTIALNREIGVDNVRVNIAIPLAHSAFEETAFTQGFLPERGQGASDLRQAELKFESPDQRTLVNLYLLFRVALHGNIPDRIVRRMAEKMPTAALRPFQLWGVYEEKRITGLAWHEGLRFFSHVGDPRRRTANYVTLI